MENVTRTLQLHLPRGVVNLTFLPVVPVWVVAAAAGFNRWGSGETCEPVHWPTPQLERAGSRRPNFRDASGATRPPAPHSASSLGCAVEGRTLLPSTGSPVPVNRFHTTNFTSCLAMCLRGSGGGRGGGGDRDMHVKICCIRVWCFSFLVWVCQLLSRNLGPRRRARHAKKKCQAISACPLIGQVHVGVRLGSICAHRHRHYRPRFLLLVPNTRSLALFWPEWRLTLLHCGPRAPAFSPA